MDILGRRAAAEAVKKPRVHKSQMLKPAVLEGAWTIDENSFREEKNKRSDSGTNFKVHFSPPFQ